MFLAEYRADVYFCASLIELTETSTESDLRMAVVSKRVLDRKFCINDNNIVLFDSEKFMSDLKRSSKNCQNRNNVNVNDGGGGGFTQEYLFVTQAEVGYLEETEMRCDVANSQYMRANSILDALENIGYYGYVTFIGIVQRVGVVQCCQQAILATQQIQSQKSFQLK